jgi:hypothetical protein
VAGLEFFRLNLIPMPRHCSDLYVELTGLRGFSRRSGCA